MDKNDFYEKIKSHILNWHYRNPRNMPWKQTKDPYKIWISEIILQQTRVNQGVKYYHRFIESYPSLNLLAKAEENEILKLWQGLGYYSRARNMLSSAKYIMDELNGIFPNTYEEILKLKGVGEYTASAISSFAFGENKAVVDGNVERVLSRIFGLTDLPKSNIGKKKIKAYAQKCLDIKNPGEFNQAIMNFGALQCKPQKPDCQECTLKDNCRAHMLQQVHLIPAKKIKKSRTIRNFQYFVFTNKTGIILCQRTRSDIWYKLYEFPCLEEKHTQSSRFTQLCDSIFLKKHQMEFGDPEYINKQLLSHQEIKAKFYRIELAENFENWQLKEGFLFVDLKNLKNFAIPKIIDWYLKDKIVYLKKSK